MTESHYGLGRREAPDDRDRAHRLGLLAELPPQAFLPRKTRKYPWKTQASLNQGNTGTCVGHAWRHWLNTAPLLEKQYFGPKAMEIYRACVKVDEWRDNDWEASGPDSNLQFGTSVRAGAKVMVELGYIKEHTPDDPYSGYKWAFNLAEAIPVLQTVTPLVAGTWWSDTMFEPDKEGIVRYNDRRRVGGHAYVFHWYDRARDLVLIQNSWGRWGVDHPNWLNVYGSQGFAFLPAEDADKLIRQDGELCSAVQRKPKPTYTFTDPAAAA